LFFIGIQVEAIEPQTNALPEQVVYEKKVLPDLDGIGGFNDKFGSSIDVDDNRLIVGAYGAQGYGAVVIYELVNEEWKESAILQSSNKENHEEFGRVVALSGNTAFVSARENNRTKSVINVFEFDGKNWIESDNLMIQGSDDLGYINAIEVDNNRLVISALTVSVFEKENDAWLEMQTLLNETNVFNIRNVKSVSVSGNYIILGATNDQLNSYVYLYEYENKVWHPKFIFIPHLEFINENSFGKSISVLENRILIGSPNSGTNESGLQFGMAFLYKRSEKGDWQIEQIFEETGNQYNGQFGSTVKLLDDKVLIGSWDSNYHDFGDYPEVNGAVYLYGKFEGEETWRINTILTPSTNEKTSYFGTRIEYSNDSIFIGSPNGFRQGFMHQFDLNNSTWSWTKRFELEKGSNNSYFGNSVSVFGNKVLIGSKGDIDIGYNFGSASIFELKNGQWQFHNKLLPSDGTDDLNFGTSVSLSERHAVISAGTLDDLAVYVFELIGDSWVEQQKIHLPIEFSYDGEGLVVDIVDSRMAIGSSSYKTKSGIYSGAVLIYEKQNSHWVRTATLTANDKHDFMGFGGSISLSGNSILIGAQHDNFGNDLENYSTGSAYIFDFVGDEWIEKTKLIASDGQRSDQFGYSLSILNDRLLVGAAGHRAASQKGKVYVFEVNQDNNWQEIKILNSGPETYNDGFGSTVGVTQNHLLIGAPYIRNDEDMPVGAVYAFDRDNNWTKTKIDLEELMNTVNLAAQLMYLIIE